MLKIIDSVDLKELEKFGFKEDGGKYFYDFRPYKKFEYSYLAVDDKKEILTDFAEYEHISKMTDLIYDLIQAGLVEKVEG